MEADAIKIPDPTEGMTDAEIKIYDDAMEASFGATGGRQFAGELRAIVDDVRSEEAQA